LKMVVHIHIFFQKIGFQRLSVKKVGFIWMDLSIN
jgi:hypothetical protein